MGRRLKGQQPLLGAEWRKRYKLLFQLVCGATITLDIAFAILVALNSYDTPKYVYIQAAVFSTVEALYTAAAFALITMHKFSNSHRDLGLALLPFWLANLSIDISYFMGASAKASFANSMFLALLIIAVLSQVFGLALAVIATGRNILELYDSYHESRRGRRGRSRSRKSSEEYDGNSSTEQSQESTDDGHGRSGRY
ncbi:hypothetical protein JCM3766R1_000583 [Sporobolomyces carnicolor]